MKRRALPNRGIARERKGQVNTDGSSKQTWSGHGEEKVSLRIKPAHVTLIGNAYLGTRNHYHMAGAFYKIFHLLLHARLTLLHQQWHEQFSYLPVSFRLQGFCAMQEKTQISPLPVPQCRHFKKFFFQMSHRYTDSAAGLCGSWANTQNEQVASMAHLWKLLLNLVFLSRNHCSKRRKSLG